ncbi:HD domain-containing protein [bacterium]|nr:HD domain-containing protein [bacterium]
MQTWEELIDLFRKRGDSQYGGEAVTQLEHALQAATLAEQQHASPQLITAALLHDVGHLLHHLSDDAPDRGIDDHHECSAEHLLCRWFPGSVTDPIRMHVAAKRYLCAVDPAYRATLSAPSLQSLQLQGGDMSPAEVADFTKMPHFEAAIQLRRWDDEAKVPGEPTPPLDHFVPYLQQSVKADA